MRRVSLVLAACLVLLFCSGIPDAANAAEVDVLLELAESVPFGHFCSLLCFRDGWKNEVFVPKLGPPSEIRV